MKMNTQKLMSAAVMLAGAAAMHSPTRNAGGGASLNACAMGSRTPTIGPVGTLHPIRSDSSDNSRSRLSSPRSWPSSGQARRTSGPAVPAPLAPVGSPRVESQSLRNLEPVRRPKTQTSERFRAEIRAAKFNSGPSRHNALAAVAEAGPRGGGAGLAALAAADAPGSRVREQRGRGQPPTRSGPTGTSATLGEAAPQTVDVAAGGALVTPSFKPHTTPAGNTRRLFVFLLAIVIIMGWCAFMVYIKSKIPKNPTAPQIANPSWQSWVWAQKFTLTVVCFGFVWFVFVTCCWRLDSDVAMKNLGENVDVMDHEKKKEGTIVKFDTAEGVCEVQWGDQSETENVSPKSLHLAAPERGADLIFTSDDREIIVRGDLVEESTSEVCDHYDERVTRHRRYSIANGRITDGWECKIIALDKTKSESAIAVSFTELGCKLSRGSESGEQPATLSGVKSQTKNMALLRIFFCRPSNCLAWVRRLVKRCLACCGCGSKEKTDTKTKKDNTEKTKTAKAIEIVYSLWDFGLILAIFLAFSFLLSPAADWDKSYVDHKDNLKADPGLPVMKFFANNDKYILMGIGYGVLLCYFSGAINKVKAANEIDELPRYGTFLIVVLGTMGKAIRFLNNMFFVSLLKFFKPSLKDEGSDDFTASWVFIELFLLATLALFNLVLAKMGLDFEPKNMNQAFGHVVGLSFDILTKCVVALICKAFYTLCLSHANGILSGGPKNRNFIALSLRRMQGWKLGVLLAATHILLDLRQNRMALNTAEYVRDHQAGFGEEYKNGPLYLRTYFDDNVDSVNIPTFWASLFFRVDEAAELGVVVPALLSANDNTDKVLMVLARSDKMRTIHSARKNPPSPRSAARCDF